MKVKKVQDNRILTFFKAHEYICAAFFLLIILAICFYNVIFFNATFMTSPFAAGTMPMGPYGYTPSGIPLMYIDPGASAWQDEPTYDLVSHVYMSGDIPLWNPYIALGTPLAASAISAVFFPLNFIVYMMPHSFFGQAFDFTILLKLFFAGFFTYCFMRELKINQLGSFASAIAFMLNGYFIFYLNMVHLNVEVLLPLLLFSFEKLTKTQDIKHIIFAGIALAFAILGGMPESTLFALFLAVSYYVFRIWFRRNDETIFSVRKYIFSLIGVFGFAGLLSAFFTFPVTEFLSRSWNAHPTTIGLLGNHFSYDTISIIIPYFFGGIHSTWNGVSQHAIIPYIGIVTILLAFCTFLVKNENRKIGLFFGCFAIFYLLKTYGFPVINLIGYLPLFNVSIFPKYLFPEFAFSLAVLAGIGVQNIWDNKIRFSHALLISSILVAIVSVFFFVNLPSILLSEKTWNFPLFPILNSVTWVMIMTGVALFFILLFCVLFFIKDRKKIDSRHLVIILILFLVLELFLYIPHFRPSRYDPFTTPPYIEYLKNDTDTYRVFSTNAILYPDTSSAYSIFDIRQLNALYENRYMSFIKRNVDPTIVDRFTGTETNLGYKNGRFLDLIGVKYILSSSYFPKDNGFIDEILVHGNATLNKQLVGKSQFNGKYVLFEHPPSEIEYPMKIPTDALSFNFCIGMDQNVWSPEKGDGVEFDIFINQSGDKKKIFSQYIDPKNNPADQKWQCSKINVSQYQNKTINISFVTLPGPMGDSSYDWAGWGDINLKSNSSENESAIFNERYELVYDDEIKIYQNRNVFPRSFIVNNAEVIKDEKDILDRLDNASFDLRNSIIIEKDPPPGFTNKISKNNSTVNIIEYNLDSVVLQANMESEGFLIISDTYYPGWQAYIDGKETDIYEADYFLRAVYLEKGDHRVVFKYIPDTFWFGLCLSLATVIVIFGYFLLRFVRKIH
jgi:hypothetical protein